VLAASTIRTARHRAGLTQAELAARAGTSQPAVAAYEASARQPSVATLVRLLEAAGFASRIELAPAGLPEPEEAARQLVEVLELAEHLPHREPGPLRFPRFARRA